MSREIKFRAWDKGFKHMAYREPNGYGISFSEGIGLFTKAEYLRPSEDFELMQYTGLKDKNGKEIYEGDVVEFSSALISDERDVVEYRSGFYRNFTLYEESVVIGNIHENPELLGNGGVTG